MKVGPGATLDQEFRIIASLFRLCGPRLRVLDAFWRGWPENVGQNSLFLWAWAFRLGSQEHINDTGCTLAN